MAKLLRKLFLSFFITLLVACSGNNNTPPLEITRGPYLQISTPTSIIIKWKSSNPAISVVHYGEYIDDLSYQVSSTTLNTDHEIILEHLQPDTRYYYHVDNLARQPLVGDVDFSFVTSPNHGAQKSTRIWIIGDSGTADNNAAAVRDAYKNYTGERGADLMLMLGDNAYKDGTDEEYQKAVFDMYPASLRQVVLWPTFGNHDGHTSDAKTETGPYFEIFTLPTNGEAGGVASNTEAYYSFNYANIHFISLNSHDISRSQTGTMLTWLQKDLASATQEWRIAYWHHPPYSKGTHDSDTEIKLIEMRENVISILETYGTDLVLSGHSHAYERSFLLDGHYGDSTTLIPMMILDDGNGQITGDGAYVKPGISGSPNEGIVYTVMGSSGKYALFNKSPHPVMFSSIASLGSLVLDITDKKLDLLFIDDSGSVKDFFTINKGS